MKPGHKLVAERAFTVEDVRAFTRISGDAGAHHVELDAEGRLMVHGLLTCTILTGLGGTLNYLAREMHFEFIRPVFTGDTIRAELTIDTVDEQPGATLLTGTALCTNQHGKEVLKAKTNGVVRHPRQP
jgi:acyl dehydratase